jgi:NAD(P)H-nitrite reductase large subunit
MKKVIILGNSAAGIETAEALRQADKESSIAIVTYEPFVAYQRPKLLDLLEGKLKEKDLFYRSEDFYKNNSIDLLLEKEAVEFNFNKKKVIFKDREFIEYDELVIAAGCRVKPPALKGIQKEGVVALNGLKDVKFLIENLPIAHTVVVVGSGAIAAAVARIIAAKKIDVKFLGALAEPVDGVDVIFDNPISEILGEGEVRAVRLLSNKVIGASLVIYSGPRQPNVECFVETGLKINQGILVDERFRASVPSVYAVGDVCEPQGKQKSYGWESAQKEGRMLGEFLSAQMASLA